MLSLTRRPGQIVRLVTGSGELIEVRLIECGTQRAVIGFEAPRSVQIVRGEIDDGRVHSPHRDGPDYTDLFPGG